MTSRQAGHPPCRPERTKRHCSTRVYQYQVLGLAYGPQECTDATGGDRLANSPPHSSGRECRSQYQVLVLPAYCSGPRRGRVLRCASEGPAPGTATAVRGYTSTQYRDWHTGPRNARTPTGGDRLSKRGPAFLGAVCQAKYLVLVYPRTAVAVARPGNPSGPVSHSLAQRRTTVASSGDKCYRRSLSSLDVCFTNAMTLSYGIRVGPRTPITPLRAPA